MSGPLSARLEAVAAFVLPGEPMLDVGTDHARLPTVLVARARVPRAIASDVVPGPLEFARRTVEEAGLADRIELRLCDGLEGLKTGEVATITIAGMGAGSIIEILGAGVPDGVRRLVLAPNTGVDRLRGHLDETGWEIVDEAMVEELGRLYPIVVAEPGGTAGSLDERARLIGPHLGPRRAAQTLAWARERLARCERTLAGLARATNPDVSKAERMRRHRALLLAYLDLDPAEDA